jgi:hypothetical protein
LFNRQLPLFPNGGKGYRQIIGQTIVENILSTKSYLVEKRQNIFDHCHRSSFVIDGEVVGDGRHNEQDHDAAAAVLRGDRPGSVEDL